MTERLTMEELLRYMPRTQSSKLKGQGAVNAVDVLMLVARRGLLPTEFETAVDEGREAAAKRRLLAMDEG